MSDLLAVACLKCGCDLGMWSPGAVLSCWKCGQQIVVQAPMVGLGEAIVKSALVIGGGILLGLAIKKGFEALDEFLSSL